MSEKKTAKKKFKREWIKGYLFILPNFIGFLIFMAIPIVMGLGISFSDYGGFGILALAVNTGIKGSGFFKTMFFFPTITSMVAVGIVWGIIFNPYTGPLNQILEAIGIQNPPMWLASSKTALLSIMIVAIWKQAGYYMVILLAGLQSIPQQLYEAAQIDGAGAIKRFFNVTLPMLSPTMFMVLILNIISSFQVFDLINIMTEGGPGRSTNVLVYRIYQEGFQQLKFGYASAMAYFLFLIVLIVTLIQFRGQKKWVTYM